jgi:class 3 adenylate cyclase
MVLDDLIQVSFTVAPAVRRIAYHDPEALGVEDRVLKVLWSQGASLPDGTRFVDLVRRLARVLAYVEPGQAHRVELDLAEGVVNACDLLGRGELLTTLRGEPAGGPLRLALEEARVIPSVPLTRPGRYAVEIANAMGRRAAVLLMHFPGDLFERLAPVPVAFAPYLSGKRLLMSQTFRDLFGSETIQAAAGLSVKSVAMLFTDLKGSTALYERIGDLPAFALVQQHFERLARVVRVNRGAIVKTIGDAVMASFMEPADAVRAAVQMLGEIDRFNREVGKREIILKIGIHAGPSIAVTLNDRLDWFGQTVNIAARVQGLADADEIYITEEVRGAGGVGEALRGLDMSPQEARLKGIERGVQVHRIRLK